MPDGALDFHTLIRGLVNWTLLIASVWYIVAGIAMVVKKTGSSIT